MNFGTIVKMAVGDADGEILMTGGCAVFATRLSKLLSGEVVAILWPADPDFGSFMEAKISGAALKGWLAHEWKAIEETRGAYGFYDFRRLRAAGLSGAGQWVMAHCYVLLPNGTAIDAVGAGPEEDRLAEWASRWEVEPRWGARGVYPVGDTTFVGGDPPDRYLDENEASGYAGLEQIPTAEDILAIDQVASEAVARVKEALKLACS